MTLYIKNWKKYQHYKDRNPPWVKLHFEILTSADWVMLDDASKLLAVVCILIGSRHDGVLPESITPAYLKRVAYLEATPNLKPLIDCGFLSETLADDSESKQKQANDTTETETEHKEYFFESGVIRLNKRDFERWQDAFPSINLKGELIALSGWASEVGNKWFHAIPAVLAKREREAKAKKNKPLNDQERRAEYTRRTGIV